MGLLDDQMAIDAKVFVDDDISFGESVVFTPRAGSPRTITAVVTRFTPELVDGTPGKTPRIEVELINHATLGATSIDTGGDTITLARRIGGTAEAINIAAVLGHDVAMWRLLLR